MIAVDTSALMAIANREASAQACIKCLTGSDVVLISAGTLAEVMIVASGRRVLPAMARAITDAELAIVPVTEAMVRRIGAIYQRWGKGFHAAGLNFGDCFAYELAMSRDCPLLFVGDDFARTDVKRAL